MKKDERENIFNIAQTFESISKTYYKKTQALTKLRDTLLSKTYFGQNKNNIKNIMTIKTILNLTNTEAKEFFLKQESYNTLELPIYFSFNEILQKVSEELNGKRFNDFLNNSNKKPWELENVNYSIFNNKDGKYAWRKLQLIHPVLYVSLVNQITSECNWNTINSRFKDFQKNDKICCYSYPVISNNEESSDKKAQILTWWKKIEQESLKLALDFNYVVHADITDCYGSIYTHSISWAIHTKKEAKKTKNKNNKNLIGVDIEQHIQAMQNGQTNGIPQGSVLMDFIAEIILGYADRILSCKLKKQKIENYKILRYRDDYRIFANSTSDVQSIYKNLSEVLAGLNFRINPSKTIESSDIITTSLKPDKVYWIKNKRKTENIQKWLLQIYFLGNKFPNSGALRKEILNFIHWLQKEKKNKNDDKNKETKKVRNFEEIKNTDVLISILTNIAFKNPRVYVEVIGCIGFLISTIKSEKKIYIAKITKKFSQLPNTNYLDIWLQRLTIKNGNIKDGNIKPDNKLCKKALNDSVELWESSWLNKGLRNITKTSLIDRKKIEEMDNYRFSLDEIKQFGSSFYNQDY